jgi:putative hydrolase of the HAD superfamily
VPVRAVTFDFWQTLLSDEVGTMRTWQVERFGTTLADAGYGVEEDRLWEAFAANWDRFEARWLANTGQYTPTHTVDYLCVHLGVEPDRDLRTRLIDGFRVVGETIPLAVAPGVEDCLGLLRDGGIRIGIVCDVGLTSSPTLRDRLAGLGLLGYFDAFAFSDETGWFKPAPESFRPALEGLGVDPRDAAHVGDNLRTDVAGARAIGMVSVRYTGFRDGSVPGSPGAGAAGEADHVVADLREIPVLLGLA